MIKITKEKNCCGCGACSAICPTQCIEMEEGTLGHLFPHVHQDNCIRCGKCEKACPMLFDMQSSGWKQSAYAAYAKDGNRRWEGSSGGMFGIFAHQLLQQGFLVYGAAFDDSLQLKCTAATSEKELIPLFKSKYLQSQIDGAFSKIEEALKKGSKILFVSTPCQVTALKAYLGKEYEELVTVDFFCHGVPSQHFFNECLKIDSARLGGEIKEYEFRSKKKNGATPHYFTVKVKAASGLKTVTSLYYKSSFYAMFQKYIDLRESCYDCQFADADRTSDITIGDFHEIDRYVQGVNRFDGVSKVIINSEKGSVLWKACERDMVVYPVDLDTLIVDGVCFGEGTQRPANRDVFIADYQKMPFVELVEKYASTKQYWKQGIYYSLPQAVREYLKKWMRV